MLPLALVFGGLLLGWSAVADVNPLAELRAVLAGKPRPPRGSASAPVAGAGSAPVGAGTGATTVDPNTRLSLAQIAAVAKAAGFTGESLATATAVAMGESGGLVGARSPVNAREDSRGLWQINTRAHPQYDPERLTTDPLYNARAAYEISQGGKTWAPWTVFTSGRYRQWLDAASQIASQALPGLPSQPQIPDSIRAPGLPPRPTGGAVNEADLRLVHIGQGSHRLAHPAAVAFAAAEARLGRPILVTDSYRSYSQQADLYRRKPNLAAPPGRSLHEVGLAVDIVEQRDPAVAAALSAAGWRQFNRTKEPWHWSYGYVG